MGLRSLLAVLLVVSLFVSSACVKRESAEVNRPIADNLAAYWTCAVHFSTDGRGGNANEGFEFVPWLETRLREQGVFEPLGRDEPQSEAEVNLRAIATTGHDRLTLRVQLFDAKTNESLGDIESLEPLEEPASSGQELEESKRTTALHRGAEEILRVLAESRKQSASHPRPKPAPPPPPDPDPVGPTATCSTQCQPTAASSSTFEEQHRVSLEISETMKSLRRCLDRVGAQLVEPVVLLRFSPDGQLHHMRVDVGGYEQNECIRNVRTRMRGTIWASRASILRCEYHCTTS